jgi:hypothetical protein
MYKLALSASGGACFTTPAGRYSEKQRGHLVTPDPSRKISADEILRMPHCSSRSAMAKESLMMAGALNQTPPVDVVSSPFPNVRSHQVVAARVGETLEMRSKNGSFNCQSWLSPMGERSDGEDDYEGQIEAFPSPPSTRQWSADEEDSRDAPTKAVMPMGLRGGSSKHTGVANTTKLTPICNTDARFLQRRDSATTVTLSPSSSSRSTIFESSDLIESQPSTLEMEIMNMYKETTTIGYHPDEVCCKNINYVVIDEQLDDWEAPMSSTSLNDIEESASKNLHSSSFTDLEYDDAFEELWSTDTTYSLERLFMSCALSVESCDVDPRPTELIENPHAQSKRTLWDVFQGLRPRRQRKSETH